MTGAVQKMNCPVNVSHWTQPPCIAKRERCERSEYQIGDEEADEPFAKLERGYLKPREMRTQSEYSRVVD